LHHRRRRISYIEIPLVIDPFIEFRGPDNRPKQKTAHEDHYEDFHVIRFPQYQNDAVIAQSIAGSPISAWKQRHSQPGPEPKKKKKKKKEKKKSMHWSGEEGLDVRVGGART
jgi:hypothetical protein